MNKLLLVSALSLAGLVSLPSYAANTAPISGTAGKSTGTVTFKGTITYPTVDYVFTSTNTKNATGQGTQAGVITFTKPETVPFSIQPKTSEQTKLFKDGVYKTSKIEWSGNDTYGYQPDGKYGDQAGFVLSKVGIINAQIAVTSTGSHTAGTGWHYNATLSPKTGMPMGGGTINAVADYTVTYY